MNPRFAAMVLAVVLLVAVAVVFAMRPHASHDTRSVSVHYESAPPSPMRSPVPAVTATPRPRARPSATPSPAATAVRTAAPTNAPATPAATATPAPAVPRFSPDSSPKIVAVTISTHTVRPGDVVSGTVETSSNVASVEAHLATYAIPMQKVGVGRFALKYQVPDIPFFFRGKTYAIDIVAHNTRGDTVSTSVPVMVR